ncbi:MAG TPA: HEAT repeat domain-containing protein, partial [Oceanipulchritudo sp.]|nr:HEAT repeat domain-containing protein [Oceanipulchritudo sp.]
MNVFLNSRRFLIAATTLLLLPGGLPGVAHLAAQTAVETVQQALEDLRSDNPETRRGGVMLIAKYPDQKGAMEALLKALEDPQPRVRRAAVVSLSENLPRIRPEQARILLRSLEDPDPEVRLGTAAWLPQLTL